MLLMKNGTTDPGVYESFMSSQLVILAFHFTYQTGFKALQYCCQASPRQGEALKSHNEVYAGLFSDPRSTYQEGSV